MKKIILALILSHSFLFSQWIEQQVPPSIGILLSIDFVNTNTGVSCGWVMGDEAYGRAVYTTNGGVNWLYAFIPETSRSLVTAQMLNTTTGYTAGACNIFSVQNKSWVQPSRLNYSKSRPIVLNSTGRGDSLIQTKGFFLKTTNSGHNWFPYGGFQQNVYYLVGMHFINLSTGFVSAQTTYQSMGSETIFKTTNGGLNWTMCYSDTSTKEIRNIYFINSNTGIAVGWALVNNPVHPVQGAVLRTTNGGNNWNRQLFYNVNNFTDITMMNNNTGFACGVDNSDTMFKAIIYKTTNSGLNWLKLGFQIDTALFEGIEFYPNSGTGICYGVEFYDDSGAFFLENTVIAKTTDYGNSWQTYLKRDSGNIPIGNKMLTLTNWYISGGDVFFGAKILHTTNGGAIGIQPISSEIPEHFSLSQNYPNPFNPATKIKFAIPTPLSPPFGKGGRTQSGGFVNLIIYDILGREIAVLVNEQLNPGTYEVNWDGTNYPSGVYFYQLSINNEQLTTKKMVLLK